MRFAFCLHQYSPYSGLARDMLRIAQACVARGHTVEVLTRRWHGARAEPLDIRLLTSHGLSNHGRARSFAHAVGEQLLQQRFDAVVGFNKLPGLDVYFAADDCYVARARRRHPVWYRLTPRYRTLAALEAGVVGRPHRTRVLCLSERTGREYQEFYGTPDELLRVLPANLDPHHIEATLDTAARDALRSELGLTPGDLCLLMVGSGFRTKGVDRAIRAVAALPATLRQRTHLLVAGDGDRNGMQRLGARLGVAAYIHFLGGRGDVADLMRCAELLLHPARVEAAGAVLLEAMAAGLPVLTTAGCGYAHHIAAAGAGEVLPEPFHQSLLDRALAHQLASPERPEQGERGRRYARRPELQMMAPTAAELIEAYAGDPLPAERQAARAGVTFWYLGHDLHAALTPPEPDFERVFGLTGRVYRRATGRHTLRFELQRRGFYLKAHTGVGWREIMKNLLYLRLPVVGAGTEWHAIHQLQRIGLAAPEPLAYGSRGWNPARRQSFIVCAEVNRAVSLEEHCACWRDQPPRSAAEHRSRRRLIAAVADTARALHCSGINHRDFYLCHLWLDLLSPASAPRLIVMDLHRAQIRRRTRRRWLVKDIAALYFSAMDLNLSRHELFRFMCRYRDATLRETLTRDARFWRQVAKRARRLYRAEQDSPVPRHGTSVAPDSLP